MKFEYPKNSNNNELIDKAIRIAKRIHPNLWKNLKSEILENPEQWVKNYGVKIVNFKRFIPKEEYQKFLDALKNKKDYFYCKYGMRRDKSIKLLNTEDGDFHGFYNSEYAGTGNGAYYIIINEREALFVEYD